MFRNVILRVAASAAVCSASVVYGQQAAVVVQNQPGQQPVAAAPVAPAQTPVAVPVNTVPMNTVAVPAAPAVAVTPAAVAVPAPATVAVPTATVPSTVVHAVPGVNSLAGSISPRPTVALTNSMLQPAPTMTQQTQIYTPTFYYYYYSPPYQVNWQPTMAPVAPVTPVMPVAPVAAAPYYNGFNAGYAGQFSPLFNARGEAGHVRYPYYSYRRPWYYPGQPSFNVTIPGHVW